LDAANRYAIIYRVNQAKTAEKRVSKIGELVAMLNRGETAILAASSGLRPSEGG
jgi:uncharacterized protein YdeI (YjbR/CyaY-like superfamily)